MKTVNESSRIVLKTDRGYLKDAYESYDDEEENFDFTCDAKQAYHFLDNVDIPKYMWNNIDQKNVLDVKELCDFLNGELIKVSVKTIVEQTEEEYNIDDLKVGFQYRR